MQPKKMTAQKKTYTLLLTKPMWLPALCTGEWISLYSKGMSLPSG